MTTQNDDFIAKGMKKYKRATAAMISFQNEMEKRLQNILVKRPAENWGEFQSKELVKSKTGRTWNQYPTAIAKINGTVEGKEVEIGIVVSWYTSESDYPIYSAWADPREQYLSSMKSFEWQSQVYSNDEWGIEFNPDENDFNLERDFNLLLDELVRFLIHCTSPAM
jgi:hypothetical protein